MPVLITKTCLNCHESKVREGNFPSKQVRRPLSPDKPQRVWADICRPCLVAQPELWKKLGRGFV